MWSISVRDLLFRRRRFAIAVLGTAAVFAMALVLSGMAAGFRVEADRTIGAFGADAWVVRKGVAGPFTSFSAMPFAWARAVGTEPGVRRADPIVVLRQTASLSGRLQDVNVYGFRVGGLGAPPVKDGRDPVRSGELVVDAKTGLALGERLVLGGLPFRVVGVVHGLRANAGIPNAYVPIQDAQTMAFQGKPVATAVITKGIPSRVPAGLKVMTNDQARADMLRPLASGEKSIQSSRTFLWVVAAIIIAAVVYLSALERIRDFAVFKATGASSRDLFLGLTLQSVIVSLVAAALAVGLARLLVPTFPLTIAIPGSAYVLLPVIAVVVGAAASLAGLRRAVTVDPAAAFGAV